MIKKKFVTAAARRSTRNPPAQTRMSMTRIDGAGPFLMALFQYKSSGGDEINKIQNWSHRLGRAASWSGVFNIHERLRRPKWRLAHHVKHGLSNGAAAITAVFWTSHWQSYRVRTRDDDDDCDIHVYQPSLIFSRCIGASPSVDSGFCLNDYADVRLGKLCCRIWAPARDQCTTIFKPSTINTGKWRHQCSSKPINAVW